MNKEDSYGNKVVFFARKMKMEEILKSVGTEKLVEVVPGYKVTFFVTFKN